MRLVPLATLLLTSVSLGACATAWKPSEISYDDTPRRAVLQPDPPKPVRIVELPKLLPLPGQLKPRPRRSLARCGRIRNSRRRYCNGKVGVHPPGEVRSIRSGRFEARPESATIAPRWAQTLRSVQRRCPPRLTLDLATRLCAT